MFLPMSRLLVTHHSYFVLETSVAPRAFCIRLWTTYCLPYECSVFWFCTLWLWISSSGSKWFARFCIRSPIPIALPVLLSETQAVFCDDLVGAVWFFNAGFYINDYLMPTTIPCRNQMNNIIRVVKIAFLSLHHWILRVPFNSHR